MGRTGRHRKKKSRTDADNPSSLDNDPHIVSLKKWLFRMGWKNGSKLKLTYFPSTGRGLSSAVKIKPNDNLISIPYEAMITYVSFESTEVYDVLNKFPKTFTTEQAFTMLLCFERHKNNKSKWKEYLGTLPEIPVMPWRCKGEELNLIPDEILKIISKYSNSVKQGFKKVSSTLKSEKFQCNCCTKHLCEIITPEMFYRSYILFMTRCVYLHYKHLKRFSRNNLADLLADEPNTILCPLLDMFNHSTEADSELEFEESNGSYFLHIITKRSFPTRSQLYISYGKHDNLSLFCYYGFYFSNNNLDFIEFTKSQIEFLLLPKEKMNFIRDKKIDENLIWHLREPSFNLIALAYISSTKDMDWKTKLYSENFNYDDHQKIWNTLQLLLQEKILRLDEKLTQMESFPGQSESLLSIIRFCAHRLEVMKQMFLNICK